MLVNRTMKRGLRRPVMRQGGGSHSSVCVLRAMVELLSTFDEGDKKRSLALECCTDELKAFASAA